MSSKETTSNRGEEKQTMDLAPRLRFPEFLGTPWKASCIGNLFRERREIGRADLPLLSLTDGSGIIPQVQSNRRDSSNSDRSKYLRVVPGDIAYNTMRMWEGRSAYSTLEGIVSPAYTVCAPHEEAHSMFFAYYFKTTDLIAQFRRYSQGLVKDTLNLQFEEFSRIITPVPSLIEQKKIAECLSSLDELIAAERQKLDALKAHKKGLMQQLFPAEGETTPRLRFPEFKGEWEKRALEDFLAERIEPPTTRLPLFSLTLEDGITPKTERYERSFLVKNEDNAYKVVRPGDFAYNPMNLRWGAIARHPGPKPVAVSKYYNIFFCDGTVDSRFCESYFKTEAMIRYYDNMSTGSLIEKRRVHFGDFLKFKFYFPTLPEQKRIADFLSSVADAIDVQAKKARALRSHKEALMQQLFPSMDEVQA